MSPLHAADSLGSQDHIDDGGAAEVELCNIADTSLSDGQNTQGNCGELLVWLAR